MDIEKYNLDTEITGKMIEDFIVEGIENAAPKNAKYIVNELGKDKIYQNNFSITVSDTSQAANAVKMEELNYLTKIRSAMNKIYSVENTYGWDLGDKREILEDYIEQSFLAKDIQEQVKVSLVEWYDEVQDKRAVDSINELNKEIKLSSDNFKILKSAVNEIDTTGISDKTLTSLIEKYPQLIAFVSNEGELKKEVIKLLELERNEAVSLYTKKLELSTEFYNATLENNQNLLNSLNEFYRQDAENFKNFAVVKAKINDFLVNNLSAEWNKVFKTEQEALSQVVNFSSLPHGATPEEEAAFYKKISDASSQLNIAREINSNTAAAISALDFDRLVGTSAAVGTKGSSASKSQPKEINYDSFTFANPQYSMLENRLSDINLLLRENNNLFNSSFEDNQKLDIIKLEVQFLQEKYDIISEIVRLEKQEKEVLSGSLRDVGVIFDGEYFDKQSFNEVVNRKNLSEEMLRQIKGDADRYLELLKSNYSYMLNEITATVNDKSIQSFNILTGDKDLKREMSALDLEVAILKNNAALDDGLDILDDEILLYKQKQDLLHKQAESLRLILSSLSSESEQYKEICSSIEQLRFQWLDINDKILTASQKEVENNLKIQADTIETMIQLRKKDYQLQKENLDQELRHFQDIIDSKIKTLNEAQGRLKYDRSVATLDRDIAKKQSQLDALGLDNSISALARKEELSAEIQELLTRKEENAADYRYEQELKLYNQMKSLKSIQVSEEKDRIDQLMREAEISATVQIDLATLTTGELIQIYGDFFKQFQDTATVSGRTLQTEFIDRLQNIKNLSFELAPDTYLESLTKIADYKFLWNNGSDEQREFASQQAELIRQSLPSSLAQMTREMDYSQIVSYINDISPSYYPQYQPSGVSNFSPVINVTTNSNESTNQLYNKIRDALFGDIYNKFISSGGKVR